jgi:hypothetical protein
VLERVATDSDRAVELTMPKYLLSCTCGRQIAVEPGQAGESLVCDCGTTVVAPTLRQLRHLPEARDEGPAHAPSWGLRQGAITISLIAAAICLALATASRLAERPVPEIDVKAHTQIVDQSVSNMTPLAAWRLWIDSYQLLAARGFEEVKHPQANAIQQTLNWHRAIQKTLIATASVCLVAAVVLALTKTRAR